MRPSWSGIWLLGVGFRSRDGRVAGTLDAVLVPFGDGAIEVHGGRIARARGRRPELERELALRSARSLRTGPRASTGRSLVVEGLGCAGASRPGWVGARRVGAWWRPGAGRRCGTRGFGAGERARGGSRGSRFGRVVRGRPRSGSRVHASAETRTPCSVFEQVPRAGRGGARGGSPPQSDAGAQRDAQAAYALGLTPRFGGGKEDFPKARSSRWARRSWRCGSTESISGFGPSELGLRREAEALALELTPSEDKVRRNVARAARASCRSAPAGRASELEGGPGQPCGARRARRRARADQHARSHAGSSPACGARGRRARGSGTRVAREFVVEAARARAARGARATPRVPGERRSRARRVAGDLREAELSSVT